ncbi:MAG: hypothetical protein J3R72DRAFT_438325 [Linnemannia gamsii]|nr:MAG: hypothetical protein J3R72DRAFT_438325 [Linnemannia gamsii]
MFSPFWFLPPDRFVFFLSSPPFRSCGIIYLFFRLSISFSSDAFLSSTDMCDPSFLPLCAHIMYPSFTLLHFGALVSVKDTFIYNFLCVSRVVRIKMIDARWITIISAVCLMMLLLLFGIVYLLGDVYTRFYHHDLFSFLQKQKYMLKR